MAKFDITSTKHVVELTSNSAKTCPQCRETPGGDFGSGLKLDEQINHYLGHGYKLLYVGPQHAGTMPITVAIMGK